MKTKSARFFGVLMALMLVASLIAAIPSTASAGTQSWSTVTIPSAGLTRLELAPVDITNVVVSGDGTIFAAAADEAGAFWNALSAPGDYRLLRSANGGQTWSVVGGTAFNAALALGLVSIIDIVPSSQTPSRVYVAISDAGLTNQVWVSTDNGTSFATSYTIPALSGNIVSMDVTYVTNHQIAIGTDVGGLTNIPSDNILILNEVPGTFPTWQPNGNPAILGPVNAISFSPNFAADNLVVAVGDDGADMIVTQRIGAGAWTTVQAFTALLSGPSAALAPQPGAVIGFPSDFNVTSNNVTFVGLNQTAGLVDDLYQIIQGAASPIDLNVGGAGTTSSIASLQVRGTSSGATLIVGLDSLVAGAAVRRSANGGTSWSAASKQPTGGSIVTGSQAFVAVAPDFATSNTVYVGTAGSSPASDAATDDQSAFSVSMDGATTFNGRSLIDTDITTIDQLVPAGGDLFVVTSSLVGESSVWRTSAPTAGADWWRILNANDAAVTVPAVVVGASPDYATDQTLWVAINDSISVAAPRIVTRKSINANSNATFTSSVSDITPASTGLALAFLTNDANTLSVLSPTSILIGDADGNVIRTVNNGVVWAGVNTPATGIASMAVSGTNVLVGDVIAGLGGGAFLSTNSGATFRALGTSGNVDPAGTVSVAFDPGFATNNLVYVAASGTLDTDVIPDLFPDNGVIDRITVGTSVATDTATTILAGAAADDFNGTGIVALAGPTGQPATLYSSDMTDDKAPRRSINPNATAPVFELTGSDTAAAALPGLRATLAGLVGAPGMSNNLWAIDTDASIVVPPVVPVMRVLTFTDEANIQPTVNAASNISQTGFTANWEAVPGATNYDVRFRTTATATAPAGPYTTLAAVGNVTSTLIGGLAASTNYEYQVRATTPDDSYWSATNTMNTQLGPSGIWDPGRVVAGGAPVVSPTPSATGVSVTPVLTWNTAAGATGFELKVSTSPATSADGSLSTADILDLTGANAISGQATTTRQIEAGKLQNDQTYYWQVRAAMGTTAFSPWSSVFAFTTSAAATTPTVTTTTIIISQPPVTTTVITQPAPTTVTITQPTPTTVTFTVPPPPAQPTPAWVWAIIAIGGILLIVVIVLIARTRKV